MPIRQLIKGTPEILSDFLQAADDRYDDADQLLTGQRYDGAAYLFGYAAEMWLKSACLRLRGIGPTGQVKSALGTLKHWMGQAAPHVPFTDYHDLSYFAECVTALRASANRPLAPTLQADLNRHVVVGLHSEWIVDMRYRQTGVTPAEALATLRNTRWVKANWLSLT